MPRSKFRLRLDIPYAFGIEPGFERFTHCQDFRPKKGDLVGLYRDQLTGLVMLQPSWINQAFYDGANWLKIADWQTPDDPVWKEAKRMFDPDDDDYGAPLLTTVSPYGGSSWDELLIGFGKAIVNAADARPTDTLKWALRSVADIPRDGGFVLQYHILADEMARHSNIFGVQWGDVFLHLAGDGIVRLYRYPDPEDMSGEPILFDAHPLCQPGEVMGKMGYLIVYPIPFYGLAVYHSLSETKTNAFFSSATAGVVNKGYLFRIPIKYAANGGAYLLEASKIQIAIAANLTRQQTMVGLHIITYPPSGTFAAECFDMGFIPSSSPSAVAAVLLETERKVEGDVLGSGVLRNPENTEDWVGGSDQQARVLVSLSSTAPAYTPFLLSAGVVFDPVFATRNTTPKTPDSLFNLEFSEDEDGRVEGVATTLMESEENRALCERGDATWVIETTDKDEPSEDDWKTACAGKAGGLARIVDDVEEVIASGRLYYVAKWRLYDLLAARTAEVHLLSQTAFDRRDIGQCLNAVMRCSALEQITPIPAEVSAISLPPVPDGQNWRMGPRVGDAGNAIIRDLLLILRRQNVEWRLYWDWDHEEWVIEKKPRAMDAGAAWTLTPWSDELLSDPDDLESARKPRWLRVGEGNGVGSFLPLPPEANILQPYGLTSPQAADGERIPGTVLRNLPSIGDANSVEYLGRCVLAQPFFPGLQDLDGPVGVNTMARRVYDAACRGRRKSVRRGYTYYSDLRPATRCILRTLDTAYPPNRVDNETPVWIKRISVTLDYTSAGEAAPLVTYHLDSAWQGDIS